MKTWKTYLIVTLAVSLWGLSFIWSKYLMNNAYQPIAIIFIRLALSTLLLYILLKVFKSFHTIKRKDIKRLAIIAFAEPFIYFIGENYGLQRVSAGVASIMVAMIPVLTPFFARIFLKERFSLFNVFGLLLSFTGICFMILKKDMSMSASPTGILFLSLAVLSAIAYGILARPLAKSYSALTIVFYQNLFGLFYFLPLFFFSGEYKLSALPLNFFILFSFIALALLCSVAAFAGYLYGVSKLGVSKAGMFTNLIPVVTVLTSVLILKEELASNTIWGMTFVIGGLFVSQWEKKKSEK